MGIPVSFDLIYKVKDLYFPLVFRVNVSTGAGMVTLQVDKNGNAVLTGASLSVNAAGNAVFAGATLSVDKAGNALVA